MQEFYQPKLDRHKINFEIIINPKGSFSRRVEKGQILQILDNLFNNSCYWLARRLDRKEKAKIQVMVNPKLGTIQFTDNGPGINVSVGDRVFDAFYTSKPEDGRGLGLYIAKRLAEENDMKITLLDAVDHRHPGFLLTFPGK
jgi:signal transduction histidine kinase